MLKKLQSQNRSDFSGVTFLTFLAFSLRRLLGFGLILERGFHLLDNSLERGLVGDGEIGKDLAIEPDVRGFQALSESAVGDAMRADGGVQPLDPKIAKCPLARFAVAIGP